MDHSALDRTPPSPVTMARLWSARVAGKCPPTVIGWRERYKLGGIAALEDERWSDRRRVIDEVDVTVAVLADDERQLERLGIMRWSARLLAAELASRPPPSRRSGANGPFRRTGSGRSGSAPILSWSSRPATSSGSISTRQLTGWSVSVDEKSQVQVPDRTAPMLPLLVGTALTEVRSLLKALGAAFCGPSNGARQSRSTGVVSKDGLVSLGGRYYIAAEILGGQLISIWIEEGTLMFFDPATRTPLRSRPGPLTWDQARLLRGARPAGPPRDRRPSQ